MASRAPLAALLASGLAGVLLGGCGTVELGDNIVPPDLMLDEDFFYCRVQPEVVPPQGCRLPLSAFSIAG